MSWSLASLPFNLVSSALETLRVFISGLTLHQGDTGVSHIENVKLAVKLLLDGTDYHPPHTDQRRKESLANTLRREYSMHKQDFRWFEKAVALGSTMAELAYPHHSYETQLLISRFTFLVLNIDDYGSKFTTSLEKFQYSMLSSDRMREPILEAFRSHLCDIYGSWDPISANAIVSSAMEFITGCLLENNSSVGAMKLSPTAQSWPYFLRQKTGVAATYAFMIFPQDSSYDISDFIQVIGDIMVFINLSNDVLSFYKEEMASETGTYIHNRAHVDGKSVIDALHDASRDAVAAYRRVSIALEEQSDAAFELWKAFVPGYLACHLREARYRLAELDL
ncbi:hypothetical protein H0H92_001344 [Tricholoma furcatifolium]|nr:hypothetical protein H0H92_001344 [Tricholoma furcatifolium]